METIEKLALKLKNDILNGVYGKSGERFMSIREFANKNNISSSAAYKIFQTLANEHLLLLIKQIWYLTYGLASRNSPLRKISAEPIIGLHIKEMNNPYIASISVNIQELLKAKNIQLIIQTSENDAEAEINILKYFAKIGCMGVINFPSTSSNLSDFYRCYPLPMIFIGRSIHISVDEYMPCVLSDNYGISRSIARKFIAQNYKNFYYISLPALPDDKNERFKGFRDGIEETLSFPAENLCKLDYQDDSAFKQFCSKIVKNSNRENPTLLFCINDLYASKIVNNLVACNADIPLSVSVIGYDDLPICSYSTPTITSVSYSFSTIAKQTVTLLLSIRTDKKHLNQKIVIENYLIHRATTSVPPPQIDKL